MCKQTCIEGTDRILCIICSNWFHFDCTNISKKTFDKIKNKSKQFSCQICKTNTKCYQCECSLSAYKNQLYCIVCLRKFCAACHSVEKIDLNLKILIRLTYVMSAALIIFVMSVIICVKMPAYIVIAVTPGCTINVLK